MSGKNPTVLPLIFITFTFLTAVTADCQRKRCKTQIQGFWRKSSDRLRSSRAGAFRNTHKSFRRPKSSNSQSNQKRGENNRSFFSRSKGFSRDDLRNFFSRFRPTQPRKTKVDAETRGHNLFTKPRSEDKDLEDSSRKIFWLRKFLGADSGGTGEKVFDNDVEVDSESECPWTNSRRPRCTKNSRYRTVDGSCNNAGNPLLGMSGTPFRRLLASTYGRFDNAPRKAADGGQLPSAREVTQTVFSAGDERTSTVSTLFMQVGQFLDHDITHTPNAGIGPIDTPQCCLKDSVGRDWVYPSFNDQPDVCFPIEVPQGDRFWGRRGRRCMHLSRSSTSPTVTPSVCEPGRWEEVPTSELLTKV